jgi:hypothetical protein
MSSSASSTHSPLRRPARVSRPNARKLKLSRGAAHPVVIGRAKKPVAAGSASLVVRLSARAQRALKKTRAARLHVTIVLTDDAGNHTTRTTSVTLTRSGK